MKIALTSMFNIFSLVQTLNPPYLLAQTINASAEVTTGSLILFAGFLALMLGLVIFWLWMLIAAIRQKFDSRNLWIAILLLGGWLGAIIFYFAVYRDLKKAATPPLPPPWQTPPQLPPPQVPPAS